MKTVAAHSPEHLVRLGAVPRLAPPDAEQSKQHALVSYRIEFVEFRLNHQILAGRIEQQIGPDPRRRSISPLGACNNIGTCLLYTSDAADDLTRVDLGGR